MATERISAAAAQAAYAQTGLRPIRRQNYDEHCACPIMASYAARGHDLVTEQVMYADVKGALALSDGYVEGFLCAVDQLGAPERWDMEEASLDWDEVSMGYADGLAVAAACFVPGV
jgi:hypothetical protein